MTTPSSHEGYRSIARRALRGRDSVVAKTDWEVFLHGFADTNQLGDSRRIYDCLINLFPTPEAVLRWPVHDPNTGEKLELPETGGCQNFRSRIGAGNWLRRNAENWEGIRAFLRCDTPEKKRAARDFLGRTTRGYIGSLNRRLRNQITGAGMKGADMHLLWGGCEVPVIDIQLVRYMAPHVIGMDFKEYSRQRLIEHKAEGKTLQLDPDRPRAERRILAAKDIDVDDRTHVSAMEKSEISKIQANVGDYNRWREAAYQMAEAEGIPANQWHVATWLESRAGGDPDRKGRRSMALIAADNALLEATQEFSKRTFGPTDFPEAPASWPLPPERYPNRERRKRLVQMRSDGVSRAEMAQREGITLKKLASDLEYYDLQQSRLDESPSAVTDDQMNYLNAEINDLTGYGFRDDYVERGRGPAYKLVWSSARAEWDVFNRLRVGATTRLDANQFIGYGKKADLEEAMPLLDPLPLYYGGPKGGSYNYKREQYPGAMTPAHEKEYLEGVEGRRFPWGQPPLPHPPPHILGQLKELKTRAEKEAGMNPELYEDIVDWFLHHPDHNEIDLRTRGSHFEQAVGGHPRAGDRVGASVGATVRHFSDKQLREYFAPLLEWTEIAGQNIPGHPHPRPRILRSKGRRTRVGGFTSPPHLADARARPPIGWEPLEQPRPRTDQPDYGYPPSEGYTGFPGAFVGFETPFGFDEAITASWQDWVQYKIGDTPVVVRRVNTKPGTKIHPRYKGATAPKELQIDFRLRASNRKDMQKVDFLLERLREDNPNMTVKVNVKTNGSTAKRNLPSWQERPYRLAPADYGVSEDPAAKMPFMDDDEGPEGISGPFAAGTARMWDWYRRMEQDVAKQVRDGILTDAQAERDMELIVLERDQEIENLRRETGGGTWAGLTEEIARRVRVAERLYSEWQRETFEKMNAGTITGEEAARRLGEDKKDYEGELDIIRRELGSRPEGNIKYTDPDYRDPSRASTPFDGIDSYANDIMELV